MRLVTASLIGLLIGTPLKAQDKGPLGEPVEPTPAPVEEAAPPREAPAGQETPVAQDALGTPAAEDGATGEREREHVVRKGDTLWDLAGFYFDDPWVWPSIYQANTGVVEDPHWIYPAEVLVIPGLRQPAMPTSLAERPARPLDRPTRTVFYRAPVDTGPSGPTVITDEARRGVPVRPGEFHSAEFLSHPDALQVMGRMIRTTRSSGSTSLVMRGSAHPRDNVYLSYVGTARPRVGQRLLMVRERQEVDEVGNGVHVIQPTAIVRVVALSDEVMEAHIESQFHDVHLDQKVIPLDMYPDFLVEAPDPVQGGGDLEGRIVEFVSEQPLYGHTERGFIDLGARDGVAPGDIFMAYVPERAARQREVGEFRRRIEQLPPEAVAELRILRVTDTSATFLVENVMHPVLEDGIRVRRIRRMP